MKEIVDCHRALSAKQERLDAAEKVIAAARSLLMDTPLGVPSARTLSQALVVWDGTEKEEFSE